MAKLREQYLCLCPWPKSCSLGGGEEIRQERCQSPEIAGHIPVPTPSDVCVHSGQGETLLGQSQPLGQVLRCLLTPEQGLGVGWCWAVSAQHFVPQYPGLGLAAFLWSSLSQRSERCLGLSLQSQHGRLRSVDLTAAAAWTRSMGSARSLASHGAREMSGLKGQERDAGVVPEIRGATPRILFFLPAFLWQDRSNSPAAVQGAVGLHAVLLCDVSRLPVAFRGKPKLF